MIDRSESIDGDAGILVTRNTVRPTKKAVVNEPPRSWKANPATTDATTMIEVISRSKTHSQAAAMPNARR